MKGSGVVFMHREGISTPRVRRKRQRPLIKCANMNSIFMFHFTYFISFCTFYTFYLFVVDEGVSLAPTYSLIAIRKSDLRSSLWTKCLIKLFLSVFLQDMFLFEWKVYWRRWTVKQTFDSFEKREDIKALDHLMFFLFFERGNKITCWF